jgi:hypothetical protein
MGRPHGRGGNERLDFFKLKFKESAFYYNVIAGRSASAGRPCLSDCREKAVRRVNRFFAAHGKFLRINKIL